MRFPLAALFFLITSFIFFVSWAVTSYLLSSVSDAMSPLAATLSSSGATDIISMLPTALGIICALFFITGILLIFVLDSWSDEPEMYFTRRR